MALAVSEVSAGDRFEFGRNRSQFLSILSSERIAEVEASLKGMPKLQDLQGKTFLDVDCGSGLFSPAVRALSDQGIW